MKTWMEKFVYTKISHWILVYIGLGMLRKLIRTLSRCWRWQVPSLERSPTLFMIVTVDLLVVDQCSR